MRDAARNVLGAHGIHEGKLRLLNHDFNTTFRVDCPEGRFALRINLNSPRTVREVGAEAAWVAALHADTDLVLPHPHLTENGETVVATSVKGVDRELAAVVYSWLDGPNLGERMTVHQARAMGQTIAALHAHGEYWQPPSDTRVFRINSIMMDLPDRRDDIAEIDESSANTIEDAHQMMAETLAPVFSAETHVIHADVHMWNAKWHADQISIFDFDDCGIGVPLQDLGISAFYLRSMPRHEAALLAGYAECRPLPDHTAEQFEALLASRNLVLLHDVVGTVTAGYDDFAPVYVKRTARRLAHWLDTGVFDLNPTS